MPQAKTPRQIVLDGLYEVTQNGAYSGLVLDHLVQENGLSRRDIGFVTRLFYGVLERSVTLDYAISVYTGKPLSKLDMQVRNILKMGLYQLKEMDAIPDSAAVNESVKLVGYAKKASAKGLVNAILRRFIREGKQYPMPDAKKQPRKALSVETACPEWILSLWEKQYGREFAKETALAMLQPPAVVLRVNTQVITAAQLKKELEAAEFVVETVSDLPDCLILREMAQSVAKLPQYQKGAFYVQDIASQYCVKALDPQKSERILDLCAAPGGKSIGAAIAMQDTGEIRSFDLFAHKVRLIEENAARMGLNSIHAAIGDAAVYNENLGLFDRVLCDVPCSGLGVIRRKPEIRNKPEAEVKALPALQLRILENAARYLKAGGILIYSTCTINRLENEDVCKKFLQAHKDFTVLQTDLPGMRDDCGVTLHPVQNDSDGFYIAKLQKK